MHLQASLEAMCGIFASFQDTFANTQCTLTDAWQNDECGIMIKSTCFHCDVVVYSRKLALDTPAEKPQETRTVTENKNDHVQVKNLRT